MRIVNESGFAAFFCGAETHAYRSLGCHREIRDGIPGYMFRVWAPHAAAVSVAGSFNGWDPDALPMVLLGDGIYEAFSAEAQELDTYKYCIETAKGNRLWKADPYAFSAQKIPETASRICTLAGFEWRDGAYRRAQARKKLMQNPIHIYELHIGSWRHKEDGSPYSYRELARTLIPYVLDMGYTHIELMPLGEYFDENSLGYRPTGLYAPTSRYGEPQDLMALVDECHRAGIGVILDWTPACFAKEEHGLMEFDGACCYEPADPVMGESPLRDVRLFDHSRGEVQSFLLSNAVYWIEEFHFDGLRIGDVAGMLHLNHGRHLFTPNEQGGTENLAGEAFLRKVSATLTTLRGNLLLAIEDASSRNGVTHSPENGGFGFSAKWCTDWVKDLCDYLALDPIYRKFHHENLTFAMSYFYAEQMLLPLSHDEVNGGKASLIERMPGYYDDRFANLRTLLGYQIAHPGKKLSFMGNEFGQFAAWDPNRSLDWFLLAYDRHRQLQDWVRDLNRFYLENRPLWHNDSDGEGFRWIRLDDADRSVIAFRRIDRKGREIIVLCNFCPVTWDHYRLGLPKKGCYLPVLSSDDPAYGGTGVPLSAVRTEPIPCDGLEQSAEFILPPLSISFYLPE